MEFEDEVQVRPSERNKKRRDPQLKFGEDGFVIGWNYEVMQAFRPALDIVFSVRVKTITGADGEKVKKQEQTWTEGDPPMYSFRESDALSSREKTGSGIARYIAQVTQATADALDGRQIVPGRVGFRFFEWQEESRPGYRELGWFRCTQAEFVELLTNGGRPSFPALTDPRVLDDKG